VSKEIVEKQLFNCELTYSPSPHLSQIFEGFRQLEQAGVVALAWSRVANEDPARAMLKVKVNGKIDVIYDTNDGLNWIDGTIAENLEYFQKNISADYYFKRSYHEDLLNLVPVKCKIYPLGFNYPLRTKVRQPIGITDLVLKSIESNHVISRAIRKNLYLPPSKELEFPPCLMSKDVNILFLTRLWNPDQVLSEHLKNDREIINIRRVECIKACKSAFGKSFIGGLIKDAYSSTFPNELMMPYSLTHRKTFLNTIKESAICVSTVGLHGSTPWKFGEYVAASRAIVSEPLVYKVSGPFVEGRNYCEFNSIDELLEKLYSLMKDREMLFEMMRSNYEYYNNYLRPDMLVLNTLLHLYHDERFV